MAKAKSSSNQQQKTKNKLVNAPYRSSSSEAIFMLLMLNTAYCALGRLEPFIFSEV